MSKPVILTGLRANNDLHIGNYFGALLPMVDMATTKSDEYQINLFVPDLHSFTTPTDLSTLQAATMNNLHVYAAAGLPLNNPDVHIYRQSYVPAHSELTIILNSFTGFGEMSRMTQFKIKSKDNIQTLLKEIEARISKNSNSPDDFEFTKEIEPILGKYENVVSEAHIDILKIVKAANIELIQRINDHTQSLRSYNKHLRDAVAASKASVGLFDYPVLMAADILLYGAQYVPVGDDQTQHLEFTRDIAGRMNGKFGKLFILPEPVAKQHEFFGKDQGLRIMDLADPTKKMSKSDDTGKGVIFLTDSPEEASKKVMSATTDSVGRVNYDAANQPGVTNLLDIYALLGGNKDEFIGQEQYGPLKSAVAEKISAFLTDFQTKLASVNDEAIVAKLEQSEQAMNQQANSTLLKVQQAVGLRPKGA